MFKRCILKQGLPFKRVGGGEGRQTCGSKVNGKFPSTVENKNSLCSKTCCIDKKVK